jgi:orotate phosphoribosyltransferase
MAYNNTAKLPALLAQRISSWHEACRQPKEMTTTDYDERVQQELLSLLTARKGHFRLESGHHGDLWLNLDLLFLRPRSVRRLAIELAGRLARYDIAAVCGPQVGGALLAQTIAAELDLEFCYAERVELAQHEDLPWVEYRVPRSLRQEVHGKGVAVVDDVINAGSAVRGTLADLQLCGAQPVVTGALLVLGAPTPLFLAGRGIPLESIAYLSSGLWAPLECPLCASHVPLEDIHT